MIERLNNFKSIEVADENEEFCIVDLFPDLMYEPNFKMDRIIFYNSLFYNKGWNSGETIFVLTFRSVIEYFEVVEYLCSRGYYSRISFFEEYLHKYWSKDFSFFLEKTPWSLSKIKKNKMLFDSYLDNSCLLDLYIEIKISYKNLNKFREDLKSLKGYKFTWRKENYKYDPRGLFRNKNGCQELIK